MVKESIINLKKALSNSLQTVPNLIEVLKRGLDGIEEAAEEENTYSTDERVVGKWIDGSDVYEKTFTIDSPVIGQRAYPHNITNYGTTISANIIGITANRDIVNTSTINGSITIFALYGADATNVYIETGTQIQQINVTIKYTKGTANRSPENNIKNNGNEEKNTDER